jgi:cobalamin biosynthesis protein CobD/CbiB
MRKKVFNKNKEILIMYGFMVFVWFCIVVITFVNPWLLKPVAWSSYGQQIASFVIFVLLLIPFIYLLRKNK